VPRGDDSADVRAVPVVVGAGAERGEAGAAKGREIGVSEVEPGVRDGDPDSESREAEIAGRGADPLDARRDDLPGAPAAAAGFGVRADGTVRDDGDDLGVLFEELPRGDRAEAATDTFVTLRSRGTARFL